MNLGEGKVGYVAPIHVKAPCLKCHGIFLTRDVTERLQKEYPDNSATGFKAGEFRGLFWVEVK